MDDVSGGRINCNNLTDDEWLVLQKAYRIKKWFTPDEIEWVAVRGLLALVDVRRGYELRQLSDDDPDDYAIQFGVGQIKINTHGIKAIRERRRGRFYTYGKPITPDMAQFILDRDAGDDDKIPY